MAIRIVVALLTLLVLGIALALAFGVMRLASSLLRRSRPPAFPEVGSMVVAFPSWRGRIVHAVPRGRDAMTNGQGQRFSTAGMWALRAPQGADLSADAQAFRVGTCPALIPRKNRPMRGEESLMSRGSHDESRVWLTLEEGFRFHVEFDSGAPDLVTDEPFPLGLGGGQNPIDLLGAAIGSCLASSFLFCVRKARIQTRSLEGEVVVRTDRNEQGRLRIARVDVHLAPGLSDAERIQVRRCAELYESFCTVTESVRDGIPVNVVLEPVPVSKAATPSPDGRAKRATTCLGSQLPNSPRELADSQEDGGQGSGSSLRAKAAQ